LRTRGAAQPVEDGREVLRAAVSASVAAAPSTVVPSNPKAASAGSAVRDGKFEF